MRASAVAIIAFHGLLSSSRANADATEAAAQVHLDRGVAAFERGDYEIAHRELAAARDLVPHKANPYRWLALVEIQLGDCTQAVTNIDSFVSRVAADDARLAELARLRDLCQRTGILNVTARPPATLRIDGAIVGTTPFRALSMRAGAHQVVAEKPGFVTASRSVVVTAGQELTVHLDLAAPGKPITRRWWFWALAAGTAIAAGTAFVLVIDGDDPSRLPPIQCDPAGCRP